MKSGVDGVYKVMKAERLSRKSLTEGVTLSLAEFESESGSHWVYTSVRWAFHLVIGMNSFKERKYRRLLFQPMSL